MKVDKVDVGNNEGTTLVQDAIADNLESAQKCHALVLLGDLPARTYPMLREDFGLQMRGLCVLGNHDGDNWTDWLPRYKFQHLHTCFSTLKVDEREIMFGGFSGSERYKNEGSWQWQDNEAAKVLKQLPGCDIFMSHTTTEPPDGYHIDSRHRGIPAR